MKKLLLTLLVLVMAVSVIAGCGPTTPASTTAAPAPVDTGETPDVTDEDVEQSDTEGVADPGKKLNVGITLQSLENSYWAGVFGEVEKLLQEKGWDFSILSCNDNSAVQITQIENFIANEVDLIMVHPSDPNALEDYLKQARDAGIKVMCWDDRMENTDLNWVLDNTKLGHAIGSAAAEFINEHYSEDAPADVAIMNYPQTPILLERETGILAALEENAEGKFTVVAQQPALDAQTALGNMETILQANPNVKVVCSIGAGGDIGANEFFMSTYDGEIPDDVGIFSADATEQQLEAISKGQASRASVGFEGSNKRTAAAVVDLYQRLLDGEAFEEQNLVRPLLTINKDNAEEYLADFK